MNTDLWVMMMQIVLIFWVETIILFGILIAISLFIPWLFKEKEIDRSRYSKKDYKGV